MVVLRSVGGMVVVRNVGGITSVPRKQVVEDIDVRSVLDYARGRPDRTVLNRKEEGVFVHDNVKGRVVRGEFCPVYVSYVFFLLFFCCEICDY